MHVMSDKNHFIVYKYIFFHLQKERTHLEGSSRHELPFGLLWVFCRLFFTLTSW